MTESDPTRETPAPRPPLGTWDDRIRLSFLTDWVARQRGSFTDAALERTAIATGYTHEEFVAAIGFAEARVAENAAIRPIRSSGASSPSRTCLDPARTAPASRPS